MIISLHNRTLNLDIDAPVSKSIAHRELIVRTFCSVFGHRGETTFDILLPEQDDSVDISATKECLLSLLDYKNKDTIVLPCRESGSTLRFMIPVASAFLAVMDASDKELVFATEGRLYDRPLDDLARCLEPHGVKITGNDEDRTIHVTGEMKPGVFVIDGSVSSQYISGLLMAVPMFETTSRIEVTGEMSSIHYIGLTIEALFKYGVRIEKKDNYFEMREEDYCYREVTIPSGDLKVEGDWSGGAFLICLGLLLEDGSIRIKGLDINSSQGDVAIVDFLEELGIQLTYEGNDIIAARPAKIVPMDMVEYDCRDIPDIVPYMAVLSAVYSSRTILHNVGRLKVKESDRLEAVRECLGKFGYTTSLADEGETLVILGGMVPVRSKKPVRLSSYNDHRMVMTAVLLAAAMSGDVEIDDINCVSKSFPGLIDIIKKYMAPSPMQSVYRGDVLKLTIYGESHSKRIGVYIEGLPGDVEISSGYVAKVMKRRAPGQNKWSTPRSEEDKVIFENEAERVHGYIVNANTKPKDYDPIANTPRPSHADYTARLLYGDDAAKSGGGIFSGRMTAPLCIAGAIAKCELEKRGIKIYSHLLQVEEVSDVGYYEGFSEKDIAQVPAKEFPVIDDSCGKLMIEAISRAQKDGDSVGGVIETVIYGMPGGIGGPLFDGIEGKIAQIIYAIPAVKGVEFGYGFESSYLRGSENNDPFVMTKDGHVTIENNKCGGILGGISVGGGVPVVFSTAIKPTPSIAAEQKTVDLVTRKNTTVKVPGRHDPCIAPRAVPVVECAAAIAIYDMILSKGEISDES
ncbi:chorismate synthase [Ruminococcaceae bacterium YRB3002]|nr:chorismate synthase [Ruminococcaceae bacterium YRB3002]